MDLDVTAWNPNADPRVQPGAINRWSEEPLLGQWAKVRLAKDPTIADLASAVKFTRENLSRAAVALLVLFVAGALWSTVIRPVHPPE